MVTGDHARTAVSVAHKCGMLCQNQPVRCGGGGEVPGGGAGGQRGSGGEGLVSTSVLRIQLSVVCPSQALVQRRHLSALALPNPPQVAFADTAMAEGRVEDSDLALAAAGPDGSELPLSSTDQLLGGVAAGSLAAAVTGRGFEKVGVAGCVGGGAAGCLHLLQGR